MTTGTMSKDTSTDVESNENATADEAQPVKTTRGPGRPPGKMPKEEKPRKPKKWADDPLAYHRNYYREKLMHPCSCEICGVKSEVLSATSGIRRNVRRAR